MTWLALDTATRWLSVAVGEASAVRAEIAFATEQAHSTTLLPAIQAALDHAGVTRSDITALVVARGPGRYNGLRVGVSMAKALAFAWNRPLYGVTTLAALAYPHIWGGQAIWALQGAGRTDIIAARFIARDGQLVCESPETLYPLADISAQLEPASLVVATDLTAEVEASLRAGAAARWLPPLASVRRAAALIALGEQARAAGDPGDAKTLEPFYARAPQVTLGTRKPG